MEKGYFLTYPFQFFHIYRNNWCFVNAILQALVACPTFYNLVKALPEDSLKKASMVKFTKVKTIFFFFSLNLENNLTFHDFFFLQKNNYRQFVDLFANSVLWTIFRKSIVEKEIKARRTKI